MRKLFGSRVTTKADVIMAVATALVGIWKASDTIKKYNADKAELEENK